MGIFTVDDEALMCTKTTAHTKKHDSHPSSLWASVSAEDDWYYDCCAVGSAWGMFLWHQRPLSVLLHVPAERERRVESRQTTGCFCDQGSSWKFKHIYIPRVRGAVAGQVDMKTQSFLWTPYNLKGNGCFPFFSFYPSEEYEKMSEGGDFALIISLWLAGRKKNSSQNMDPHPMIRSLHLSWLTIENMVKRIDRHIL